MFNIVKRSIEWGGKTLSIETGKIARQADGAVIIRYGDSMLLCTAVASKENKPDLDFFPLAVHYMEKFYAAGRFPGGFFKREAKPSDKATLTSRLIDRPIRPLFPASFKCETQVICMVMSHDLENDPDIIGLIGASAALAVSGLPFTDIIGGARVGYINNEYVLNPTIPQLEESDLDLVVAATKESVMMVESEANCLSQETMLGAVQYGHEQMQPVIAMIEEMKAEVAKPARVVEAVEIDSSITDKIKELSEANLRDAYAEKEKQARVEKISKAKKTTVDAIAEDSEVSGSLVGGLLKKLEKDIVRNNILDTGIRIDGRDTKTVRPIATETSLIPKTHGSALFTRGETQAIAVITLGSTQDEQIIDDVEGESRQHFLLHYNFPSYSVGEAGRVGPPGRREIGHGKLAWRSLKAVMPAKEEFPYSIRIVSEITESNGSSSMATVCGSSLAMMDAGVPIKKPVAGIAMGLIKEGDRVAILSDIMGDEDHLGDMDFKVAGTDEGITALQMDIKINGITKEIMETALAQADEGRLHILGEMAKTMTESRGNISSNAPRMTIIQIDKEKIRDIIGPGGKIIRSICEQTNVKLDVEDDGTVKIVSVNEEDNQAALEMIEAIVFEPEIGDIFDATVSRIVDFGAFVKFFGEREGLVHISEFADKKIDSVEEFVKEGDTVKVIIVGVDQGRPRFSYRAVDQETGEDLRHMFKSSPPPKRGGGGRGGDKRKKF